MNDHLVSLIIPIYNMEKFIAHMLDSVFDQTYRNIEVIAVNDCSTDSTPEILRQYKLKFEADNRIFKIVDCKVNGGVCAAVNCGLKEAEGDYLCFPDADDELHSEYVEAMLTELENNPEYKWVRCDYTILSEIENHCWDMELPDQSMYKNDFYDISSRYITYFVWNMMVERDYFYYCINENIFDSRLTQEWSLVLPLSYHSNYLRCHKKLYKYLRKKVSKSTWVNEELNSVLEHMDGLVDLNEEVLSSMNIPDDEIAFCQKAVNMYYSMRKIKVFKSRELYDDMEKEYSKLLNLIEPYVDRKFALEINDPDLLVRFAFDNMLEMRNNIDLYENYLDKFSSDGYILFMDNPGKGLYNAAVMAFGKPEYVSENFEADSKYASLPKVCIIENSGKFKKLKETLGGNENLYFDYRDVRDAIREWAYLKGWK